MISLARKVTVAAILLMVPVAAIAQSPTSPREPVDSGAIIMPPETDQRAVRPAPEKVDPEMAVPVEKKKPRPEKVPPRKRSKEDDCQGRKELCRQSSPK